MFVVDENLVAMGADLAHAYRVTLLVRINDPELTEPQRLEAWKQIAQIDRWIGVNE